MKANKLRLMNIIKKQQEIIHAQQRMLKIANDTVKGLDLIIKKMHENVRRYG
jgi:hypothetical protein